jgi:hypothetical protein
MRKSLQIRIKPNPGRAAHAFVRKLDEGWPTTPHVRRCTSSPPAIELGDAWSGVDPTNKSPSRSLSKCFLLGSWWWLVNALFHSRTGRVRRLVLAESILNKMFFAKKKVNKTYIQIVFVLFCLVSRFICRANDALIYGWEDRVLTGSVRSRGSVVQGT